VLRRRVRAPVTPPIPATSPLTRCATAGVPLHLYDSGEGVPWPAESPRQGQSRTRWAVDFPSSLGTWKGRSRSLSAQSEAPTWPR